MKHNDTKPGRDQSRRNLFPPTLRLLAAAEAAIGAPMAADPEDRLRQLRDVLEGAGELLVHAVVYASGSAATQYSPAVHALRAALASVRSDVAAELAVRDAQRATEADRPVVFIGGHLTELGLASLEDPEPAPFGAAAQAAPDNLHGKSADKQ